MVVLKKLRLMADYIGRDYKIPHIMENLNEYNNHPVLENITVNGYLFCSFYALKLKNQSNTS